jgi:hypothetical protein
MIVIVWKEYEEGPTPSDVAYTFLFQSKFVQCSIIKDMKCQILWRFFHGCISNWLIYILHIIFHKLVKVYM